MSIIITKRLVLRPLTADDAVPLASVINNRRVAENLTRVPNPYVLDDVWRWFGRDQRGSHVRAITCHGALIGVIGLESDTVAIEAELGYWLGEPWWAKGYGREAAQAMRDFGFMELGYDRLYSGYRNGNEASRRILLGLGFRPTGHKLAWSLALGRLIPVATLELTRGEWRRRDARS